MASSCARQRRCGRVRRRAGRVVGSSESGDAAAACVERVLLRQRGPRRARVRMSPASLAGVSVIAAGRKGGGGNRRFARAEEDGPRASALRAWPGAVRPVHKPRRAGRAIEPRLGLQRRGFSRLSSPSTAARAKPERQLRHAREGWANRRISPRSWSPARRPPAALRARDPRRR